MSLQMLSLGVAAQLRGADKKSSDKVENEQVVKEDDSPKSKISPDLEETADEAFHGMRSDTMQKVIIQLR